MGWFNKGKSDAQQNKGPQDTNGWASQDKEKYDAGYNHGKKK